ncbi:type II toxin-antitoxin system RelE/ParE family toxin [Facilibium subflavum]|uniref:type II toxin-antitoxin system RelE/ParE family toxin n=1 Tax=Facilibium subflavum TaxID=2219058 RepID=UPI000E6540B3|nr:type II toxin-antitoxin system RelE/ParE family toxin [Facilibium subflavum]
MSSLVWTPNALHNMQRLYHFLVDKDPESAKRAIKAIRTGVKILVHQPKSGRPINGMDTVFREWLIEFGTSGYVVLYRLNNDKVVILSVKHQKELGY